MKGRITKAVEKSFTNQQGETVKFWIVDAVMTHTGKTYDDPTNYMGGLDVDIGMVEKDSKKINEKTGRPYRDRTFYLPNHVKLADRQKTDGGLPPDSEETETPWTSKEF